MSSTEAKIINKSRVFGYSENMNQEAFFILSDFYPEKIKFLEENDPFRFLISVILSAQTTDKKVNEVGKVLFSKYPAAKDLAAADRKDVERIIHPLGFYKVKASNIIRTSALIKESIPEEIDDLIKLPGVGRKTASCYIGDVLNRPSVIVDTHFKRVAKRLGYTASDNPDIVEKDIKAEFSEKYWYRISMVLNMHGRLYCYSRKPNCKNCPVCGICPSAEQ